MYSRFKDTAGQDVKTGVELLHAEDVCKSSPEVRNAWVSKALGILKKETPEQIAARSLDDRLSLAAAAQEAVMQTLRDGGINVASYGDRWDALKQAIDHMPEANKQELTRRLGAQLKVLQTLQIDEPYLNMTDRIHERAQEIFMSDSATREILKNWRRVAEENFLDSKTGGFKNGFMEADPSDTSGKRMIMTEESREILNREGLTHAVLSDVMNRASRAMNLAWKEVAGGLGIDEGDAPAIEVRKLKTGDRETQFNVKLGKNGGSFYGVEEMAPEFMDPRTIMHVAFHEPHHAIQGRIALYRKAGEEMATFLINASKIFALKDDYGVESVPPHVLAVNEEAERLAMACYHQNKGEQTALYQGNRAKVAVAAMMPHVHLDTTGMLGESPALAAHLPADAVNAANKRVAPLSYKIG